MKVLVRSHRLHVQGSLSSAVWEARYEEPTVPRPPPISTLSPNSTFTGSHFKRQPQACSSLGTFRRKFWLLCPRDAFTSLARNTDHRAAGLSPLPAGVCIGAVNPGYMLEALGGFKNTRAWAEPWTRCAVCCVVQGTGWERHRAHLRICSSAWQLHKYIVQ